MRRPLISEHLWVGVKSDFFQTRPKTPEIRNRWMQKENKRHILVAEDKMVHKWKQLLSEAIK